MNRFFNKKLAYALGSGTVQSTVSTVYLIAVAAVTGPSGFGDIALGLAFIGIYKGFVLSGVQDGILRSTSIDRRRLLAYRMMSLTIFAILALYMLGVFVFFGSANPLVKDLTTWAPLYSIAFISISFQSSTAGLFIRLEYFKSIFMIDSFAFGVSYLIIGLFLLFLTNEPLYLFIPIVAQLGIKALALEFLFFKAADLIPDKDASSCDFKIVSELVTMASRLIHVSSIHLDKILVGIYLGSADLGIYRMAFQIVSAPNILISKFIEQYALSKIAKRKHTTIDGGVIPFSINKYLSAVVTLSFVLLSIFAVASYSGLFDALLTSEWAVLPDILVLMSPLIALRASIKINELIYRTHITEKNYLYYCIANLLGIIGCIVIAAPAGLSWFSVSIVAFNLVFFIFGAIGIKRLLP